MGNGHEHDYGRTGDGVWRARRRRAGGIGLLLFVVGIAAAPLLDGWLHAGAESTAGAAQDGGDCVVHTLAATLLVVSAAAPTFVAPRGESDRESMLGPRAPHRTRGDRLTPPSRAPPA